MTVRIRNGWHRLPSGYDVEFRHGVPVRLSDNGRGAALSDRALGAEVTALGQLPVRLGAWVTGARPEEREAPLLVVGSAFPEVLCRLARSAATVFVDRFHKPVEAVDVDWDRLEYQKDFNMALDHCGLSAADVDQAAGFDAYVAAMHDEARRLVAARTPPPVEPE